MASALSEANCRQLYRRAAQHLADDITSWADSGGHLPTAQAGDRPRPGRAVLRRRKVPDATAFAFAEVNGGTALVATANGTALGVVALEFDGDRISGVRIVAIPAKLSHLRGLAGP